MKLKEGSMNKLQTVLDALISAGSVRGYEEEQRYLKAIAIVKEIMAQEPVGKLVINKYSDAGIGIEFSIQNPEEVLFVNQPIYAAPVAVQAVPAGFVLVPVEPTPEMVNAGRTTPMPSDSEWDEDDDYRAVYKAMLAAAPVAKGEV